jgi:hypothetical protein
LKRIFVFLAYLTFLLFFITGCDTDSKAEDKKAKNLELKHEGLIPDQYYEWNPTRKFTYQTTDQKTGESVSYEVIGKKNGFGITGPFPITASQKQKYFWFYWGKRNIKDQPVKVMGFNKDSKELITIFEGEFYKAAQINENEVNMPSNLLFPSSGIWNLLIYINNELSGNIVVEIVR